jgi:hypothetical protein
MRTTQSTFLRDFRVRRGLIFGVIIITALFAFEIFNYSTTDYALSDLLGDLEFMGLRWATILAIAFCGIDFAGIARLFSPNDNEPGAPPFSHNENWYLFGAWLLAATMNAMLTWWGVSLAVIGHKTLGNEVVGRETLLQVVPIFVAVLVWLIRVLIIGTFSVSGDRLFGKETTQVTTIQRVQTQPQSRPASTPSTGAIRSANSTQPVAAQPKNSGYRSMHTAGTSHPASTSTNSKTGQQVRFDQSRTEPVRIEPIEPEEPTYTDLPGHSTAPKSNPGGPAVPNRSPYTRNNNSRQYPR